MNLKEALKEIKNLKIQGAENVSTAAILIIQSEIKKSKAKTRSKLLVDVEKTKQKLLATRPTEPQMENYLNFIQKKLIKIREEDPKKIKSIINKEINLLLKEKKKNKSKIIENSKKLFKKKTKVFTHCHSSTVTGIIKNNKKQISEVYNTETRPRLQGRVTAKELSDANIKVNHYPDSGARIAIKNADVVLLGADSITKNKVYNKIGSEMFALVAKDLKVPVYICASLWKFNPGKEELEKRPSFEIWKNHPKKINVINHAFEKISFKLIKGIICEKGILKPKKFIREARRLQK